MLKEVVATTSHPWLEAETALAERVFGQERAISAVFRALKRAQLGFSAGRPERPLATLLFVGPTGVGKTEVARQLAAILNPDGGGFLKIDCSLYVHGHQIAGLVGAPPGYIGREQAPLLDPGVIERERSVILFDEIEKGHPDLWNLLLQIMEDGEITLLATGRRVSFRRAIVILTTNVGATEMVDFLGGRRLGFATPARSAAAARETVHDIALGALRRHFAPEWLNRLDEIVTFAPLTPESLSRVFDRMAREANVEHLRHGVYVEFTPAARAELLRRGFDPRYGARPLRALLLREVEAPLAEHVAGGAIPNGSRVVVDLRAEPAEGDGRFRFLYEELVRLPAVAVPAAPAPAEPIELARVVGLPVPGAA